MLYNFYKYGMPFVIAPIGCAGAAQLFGFGEIGIRIGFLFGILVALMDIKEVLKHERESKNRTG